MTNYDKSQREMEDKVIRVTTRSYESPPTHSADVRPLLAVATFVYKL
jgi:hypothetical protein